MNNDKLDKETQQLVAEGESLSALFASSGWQIAEKDLQETISSLKSLDSIDLNEGNVETQIKVNLAIAKSLELWVNDLKGRVNNVIMMKEEGVKSPLIERR